MPNDKRYREWRFSSRGRGSEEISREVKGKMDRSRDREIASRDREALSHPRGREERISRKHIPRTSPITRPPSPVARAEYSQRAAE